jgi:hypothetical protein
LTYSIDIDPQAQESIAALPTDALLALAEAFTLLELSPWGSRSVNAEKNSDAPVRNLPFGRAGLLTYLVLDDEQRVDVLLIAWAG